jgi:hypothetical protein
VGDVPYNAYSIDVGDFISGYGGERSVFIELSPQMFIPLTYLDATCGGFSAKVSVELSTIVLYYCSDFLGKRVRIFGVSGSILWGGID